jgi:hypothetical protein
LADPLAALRAEATALSSPVLFPTIFSNVYGECRPEVRRPHA